MTKGDGRMAKGGAAAPAVALVLLALAGCHSAPSLPTHPWVDHATALRQVRANLQQVRTVSAACRVMLVRADGQSVRLDGALAAQMPDHLRLRTWKFDQPVLDLTLTPAGVWAWSAREPGSGSGAGAAVPTGSAPWQPADLGRAWRQWANDWLDDPALTIEDTGGPRFTVRRALGEGATVALEIDKPTLAIRACRWVDARGQTLYELRLDDYRDYGGIVWPTRLTGRGPAGRFELALDQVELNGPLPDGAFVPPARAVRQEEVKPQMNANERR